MAHSYEPKAAQREAALDLLSTIAPDADAQQAQEFIRAFELNPNAFSWDYATSAKAQAAAWKSTLRRRF